VRDIREIRFSQGSVADLLTLASSCASAMFYSSESDQTPWTVAFGIEALPANNLDTNQNVVSGALHLQNADNSLALASADLQFPA